MSNRKIFTFIFALAAIPFVEEIQAQGWMHLGPDSLNWQNVQKLTGRWISLSDYHLAARTPNGVVIYEMQDHWNYILRNRPESIVNNGVSYRGLEFSPWETDSCFVEYYIAYTEADPHIIKWPFPPMWAPEYTFGGARGQCFFTPLSTVFPAGSDSVVIVGICGVQRSHDRGSTWEVVSDEGLFGGTTLIATDTDDDSILYGTRGLFPDSVFIRSTDAGLTWQELFVLPATPHPTSVVASGDSIVLSIRAWWTDTSSARGIFRSTNAGLTWNNVYTSNVASLAIKQNVMFAAAENGVLVSNDFGLSWTEYNNGLPTSALTDILTSPYTDTLYISTETHGVLKVWDFLTDIPDPIESLPTEYSLSQNYPNPFNPGTTIEFSIPSAQHVMLKVYNLLGEEVATLVDDQKSPGTHRVQWSSEGLSTGLYFYTLRSGNSTQTRKLMLMK